MGGKKLYSIILSVLISINFLIIQNNLTSYCADINIKESEKIRRELKSEEVKLKKALSETKDKIEKKSEYGKTLNSKIENTSKQIRLATSKITSLDREILQKNRDIKTTEEDIEQNKQILLKRIKAVYLSGDVGALEIVLGAKNFNDFVDKFEVITRMSEHDSKLVAELKKQIDLISKDKKIIEDNKVKISNEKALLSSKQEELKDLVEENEKVLSELNIEKDKEQSCIDENTAEYKKIDEEIKKYYAEQAKKKAANKAKVVETPPVVGKDNYVWPVPGFTRITSPFNERRGNAFHKGIDIARTNGKSIHGAPVVAVADGVVIKAFNGCVHDYPKTGSCGCCGGYGNVVFIDQGNGKMTVYGHLSNVFVHKGQVVKQGQIIGLAGCTGRSTGSHLHFGCRLGNEWYDPMIELRKNKLKEGCVQ